MVKRYKFAYTLMNALKDLDIEYILKHESEKSLIQFTQALDTPFNEELNLRFMFTVTEADISMVSCFLARNVKEYKRARLLEAFNDFNAYPFIKLFIDENNSVIMEHSVFNIEDLDSYAQNMLCALAAMLSFLEDNVQEIASVILM